MIIHGIDSKDISVVVQGAISPDTIHFCLSSIRTHLPEAQIILSTWKGSNTDGLDFDLLVLNDDPGCFDFLNMENSIKCNVNRQLYSTLQGLRSSERKYAIKMRTDFVLESADFLKWFPKYPERNKTYSFFQQKLICCELFSRNPRYKYIDTGVRHVLHPSDFFFFGLKEDLIDLFDIPLMTEDEAIYFAKTGKDPFLLTVFPPEEFLWVSFLKKHLNDISILPKAQGEITDSLIKLTEKTFASNLIILSFAECGIVIAKPKATSRYTANCFSHSDWKRLYKFYCTHSPLPYVHYRIRFFLINTKGKFFVFLQNRAVRLKNYLIYKVKPRLTPEKKNSFKPFYQRLRTLYHRFMQNKNLQPNCIKGFFQEEVTDAELSVIVQGAIMPGTAECLRSIRRYLPKAELILSTWEGSDTTGLDYDICLLNKDPGPCGLIRRYPHRQAHNVNRILVSSLAGVSHANRRYCMKIRSDMCFSSTDFLKYYNRFSSYLGYDAIVSRRIMAEGLSTARESAFALSDWWYLGLKADLQRLFSIPLYKNEEVPYFEKKENRSKKPYLGDLVCQYLPEHHILYQFIQKYAPRHITASCRMKHCYDSTPENVAAYHKFIADNLLLLEFPKTGVFLPKAANMCSPSAYLTHISGGYWLDLCHTQRTIPQELQDGSLSELYQSEQQKYVENSRYLDTQYYANIIKNYAKFQDLVTFEHPDKSINKADITFVVTGLITFDGSFTTHRCLESIRRFFPSSKIVLAVWDDDLVDSLDGLYDKLLSLKRPSGPKSDAYLKSSPYRKYASLNDQQFAVSRGMREVSTRYAVRMRTDFYLTSDRFLSFYIKWSTGLTKREALYRVFAQRVLAPKVFTFDPAQMGGTKAYSLSDCFHFGLTLDLQNLWDGHQESPETLQFFQRHPSVSWENPEQFNHRFTTEQYFFINVLKKAGLDIPYPRYYFDHSTDAYVFEHQKLMASNVIIGDFQQLGIVSKFEEHSIIGNHFTAIYTLERLVLDYLYNVEPDNQVCLDYLKELYSVEEAPPRRRPLFSALSLCKKLAVWLVRTLKRLIKALMRLILPGYRVACGIRERQIEQERIERERFDYLVFRLNQLDQSQTAHFEAQQEQKKLIKAYLKGRKSIPYDKPK